MNMNEHDFACKVRHALNERLEDLPENISAQLANARAKAIKRKKKSKPLFVSIFQQMFAGTSSGTSGHVSWASRFGLSLPILVLVVGMAGIFHHEQQRQIREIADIDVAVLSDELPPSAYADNGFRAYMVDRTGV